MDVSFVAGLVLGTLYVGGYMMSQHEVTAGDLMSFMVATQTIQRFDFALITFHLSSLLLLPSFFFVINSRNVFY